MRAVVVQKLVHDIDITVACEDDGSWRFLEWSRNAVKLTRYQADAADCARRFASLEEALGYFRAKYGEPVRFATA